MILSKFKKQYNKHQQYLAQLPNLSQSVTDLEFLYLPSCFRKVLLKNIATAKYRICIVSLYLEQDEGGQAILNALYNAKRQCPKLDVRILVDWHRAHRCRIGDTVSSNNAEWYYRTAKENPNIDIPIYGVLINTREAFGVLHFKGFIIDDSVLYSGASINNAYLHQLNKYRYDRYHLIRNKRMADIMFDWIVRYLIQEGSVNILNDIKKPRNLFIKRNIRLYRQKLRTACFRFHGDDENSKLSVTPLVGLGKSNLLNRAIFHLIPCTKRKLTICTPYFNLPTVLEKNIIQLLRDGKKVEIIVGDKTANDFFIPEDQPFKAIGILPYLYEINLRRFLNHLVDYIDNNQLSIRLWKDNDNSYHLKGIWVDDEWMLLTGNNLNPRAWRLDLENAILIRDPKYEIFHQKEKELSLIRSHTSKIRHSYDLQGISEYPLKVRKLIRRLYHVRIDLLIKRIL